MTGSDRSFRTLLAHANEWAQEHLWNTGAGSEYEEEEPLRAALFSSDQMVAHGKLLASKAATASPAGPPPRSPVLARLASNERVLEERRDANCARAVCEGQAGDRRRPNGCWTTCT